MCSARSSPSSLDPRSRKLDRTLVFFFSRSQPHRNSTTHTYSANMVRKLFVGGNFKSAFPAIRLPRMDLEAHSAAVLSDEGLADTGLACSQ